MLISNTPFKGKTFNDGEWVFGQMFQTKRSNTSEYDWWTGNAPRVKIHDETKRLITKILWNLAEHDRYRKDEKRTLSDISLTLRFWEEMYNDPTYKWINEYEQNNRIRTLVRL